MYSITLFIVLWSDHGVFGSGSMPSVAEDRMRHSSSSLTRPVKWAISPIPLFGCVSLDRRLVRAAAHEQHAEVLTLRREQLDGAHHVIDAVLLADLTEIDQQVGLAGPVRRVGVMDAESREVGAGADDEHVRRPLAAPLHGDALVALVGGDHDVRGTHALPLQPQQAAMQPAAIPAELGGEHFGRQVVMVEDEAAAE